MLDFSEIDSEAGSVTIHTVSIINETREYVEILDRILGRNLTSAESLSERDKEFLEERRSPRLFPTLDAMLADRQALETKRRDLLARNETIEAMLRTAGMRISPWNRQVEEKKQKLPARPALLQIQLARTPQSAPEKPSKKSGRRKPAKTKKEMRPAREPEKTQTVTHRHVTSEKPVTPSVASARPGAVSLSRAWRESAKKHYLAAVKESEALDERELTMQIYSLCNNAEHELMQKSYKHPGPFRLTSMEAGNIVRKHAAPSPVGEAFLSAFNRLSSHFSYENGKECVHSSAKTIQAAVEYTPPSSIVA